MSPKTTTVETLQQRVERTAAQHADASRAVQQQQAEQARRLDEHQRACDEAEVARWSPAELDEAVDAARHALTDAVAAAPITQALSGFIHAQVRRRDRWTEHLGALGRLGANVAGAQLPPAVGELDPAELILRAAARAADIAAAADRDERDHHRSTIPDTERTTP